MVKANKTKPKMAKSAVRVKRVAVKRKTNWRALFVSTRMRTLIFMVVFASIGTYFLYQTFAATSSFSFNGTLSSSATTSTHTVSASDEGTISSTLTWGGRYKGTLTFKILDSSGAVITEKAGKSPLSLNASVVGGNYRLRASGPVTRPVNYSITGTVNTIDRVTDITAPTAPANLLAVANTTTSIDFTWAAATDEVGVSGYRVFRNGVLYRSLGSTTVFTDTNLSPNTVYDYSVAAFDAAGNISAASNIAPVITEEAPQTPTATYSLDASFDRPSKSDPSNYRQKVDFNVVCKISRTATDDPIVFPGQSGRAHMHVFTGNTSVDAFSTLDSLDAGGTNCRLDRDKASYWMPELYNQSGVASVPYHMRAYYRAGSLNPVSHIPHGLRVIAGNPTATAPQDRKVAGWQCRSVSPDLQTVPKQSTIPTCASVDLLEGSVVFPNCWDGVNLDSANHKSHMTYSWDDGNPDDCPSTHPVQMPQLTIAYRYSPGTTNSSAYLASMNSGLTLHADFFNSWHQPTLDALVDRCVNAGVHCGDVYPTHFPGPLP